jgi:hypothetical protein
MERRQRIRNGSNKPLLIYVEPEAWDFWIRPGEECELRAEVTAAHANFELVTFEDGELICVSVYPPLEMGDISLWGNGVKLELAHQRPDGWPETSGSSD